MTTIDGTADCPYRNDEGHVSQRCPNCAVESPIAGRTKSQKAKARRVMRLSLPMVHHMLTLLDWEQKEGAYYGNKEQYWKRHRRIVKWLEAIRDRRLIEAEKHDGRPVSNRTASK